MCSRPCPTASMCSTPKCAFHHRPYLGELCRIVARLLKEFFEAAEPSGQPAFILYVQTWGDLANWNPHLHALVADGVFLSSGYWEPYAP